MAQEKLNRSKPHISIDTSGHDANDKTTLTEAVTKVLAENGENGNTFVDYANIDKVPEERKYGITINISHANIAKVIHTSSATRTINQSRLLDRAYMDMHLLSRNKNYVKMKK